MTTDTLGAALPPDSQPTRVQRFDCAGPMHPWEYCYGCYHMEPHTEGDYVRWEDYDRLRALNAELVRERDDWARKWHAIRAELAELKFPGMRGIIRAKGETT